MSLEETTTNLNSDFFLPEFTFANTTFTPSQGSEVELADGLIWLDKNALAIQIKERAMDSDPSKQEDDRWFDKKVLKFATKQIRDTLHYLDANEEIHAKNQRGQSVVLRKSTLSHLLKVVVYSSFHPRDVKFHRSKTAGFIHILPISDYQGVISTLATLAELFEYFGWRETLLTENPNATLLPEQSLLGHYLWGDMGAKLSIESMRFVYALNQNNEDWDVSNILHKFHARTYDDPIENNNYHRIIGEVAKLNRAGLKAFKERFMLSVEKVKKGEFVLPYRFSILGNDCGFVFAPLQEEFRQNRRIALQNFTLAHKYIEKLNRCVGLVFLADADGYFTIDWSFVEQPWAPDPEMDEIIANCFPFRETTQRKLDRYTFSRELLPGE
jgi:hypothetical protein